MTSPEQTPARRPGALWAWMSAEVASYFATRLSMVAVPWLVLTTTGSAAATGAVAAAELAPYVVVKALSGPLVDRWGGRRVSVLADLVSAAAVLLVPLLHLAGRLSLPALVVLVAVIGVLRGPGDLAKMSMAPAVAEVSGAPLGRVTGLSSVVERLASTVGAAAGGVVIAAIGPAPALLLTTAALLLAATVVRFLLPERVGAPAAGASTPVPASAAGPGSRPASSEPSPEVAPRSGPGSAPSGYWSELRAGASFLRRDGLLVSLTVMVALTNLLDQATTSVLMPVWVRDRGYGPEVLGLLFACFAAAAVGGSAVAAAVGSRLPRLTVYVICFLVAGAPRYWVMAGADSLVWVVAVMLVAGTAAGFINPLLGAVMFERIPRPLVGRVSGLLNSSAWALMPFGALLGGLVVTGAGVGVTLVGAGLCYLLVTLAPVLLPSFRTMRGPHAGVAARARSGVGPAVD